MKIIKSRPQIKNKRSYSSPKAIKSLKNSSESVALLTSMKQVIPAKDR